MKKLLVLLTLFVCLGKVHAQEKDTIKTNPIIFGEITTGFSFVNTGNVIGSLSYQTKNHLFTYRFSELYNISNSAKAWAIIIPIAYPISILAISPIKSNEYALLYGKRKIKNGFSYSFSGGISYTKYTNFPKLTDPVFEQSFIGFPFEINVRWFKSSKKRIRLLELFPIGKPTGFGGSMGIKLFGNISKQSYIGVGFTIGFGYYKNYN